MSSIEISLAKEYLQRQKHSEDDVIHHMTQHALPHEEYLINVGMLRAIRNSTEDFRTLLKAYFPQT